MIQRYPNLFIVGAPKCGTTSLAYYLSQHNDIFTPTIKEPNYFGSDLTRAVGRIDLNSYLSLYCNWAKEKYALDSSVLYFSSKNAAQEIKQDSADAKILILVRNPIDAAYSMYWQNRVSLTEQLESFESALGAEAERASNKEAPQHGWRENLLYKEIFSFSKHIEKFYKVFGQKNVKVLIFDELIKNTDETLDAVTTWLNLSPFNHVDVTTKNKSKTLRSTWAAKMLSKPPAVITNMGEKLLPLGLRHEIRVFLEKANSREFKYPTMDVATRSALEDYFDNEILSLSNLLGKDLSHWTKSSKS